MDGAQVGNSPSTRIIRIGLFGLVLIGSHAAALGLSSASGLSIIPSAGQTTWRSARKRAFAKCGGVSSRELLLRLLQ
jgi:hypothetical protein